MAVGMKNTSNRSLRATHLFDLCAISGQASRFLRGNLLVALLTKKTQKLNRLLLVECRRENISDERIGVGEKTAGPPVRLRSRQAIGLRSGQALHSASLRSEVVDFLSSGEVCGRKAPKSICPTRIAGVPRLRAIKPSVCDRSAKRSLRMTALSGGLKYSWLDMQKTRRSKGHRRHAGTIRGFKS
jgi:hypothetical protein